MLPMELPYAAMWDWAEVRGWSCHSARSLPSRSAPVACLRAGCAYQLHAVPFAVDFDGGPMVELMYPPQIQCGLHPVQFAGWPCWAEAAVRPSGSGCAPPVAVVSDTQKIYVRACRNRSTWWALDSASVDDPAPSN